MPKKGKIKAEEKIRIVQACVEGKLSQAEAASRAGVDEASIRDWLVRYRSEGSLGFVEQNQRAYSAELKLQAVTDYLSGGLSQRKICEKYHIRSNRQLRNWIKVYNTHGEIKSRASGGGSYMKKGRQTTSEERLKIVQDCLVNDKNYGAMALKYNCSYQQVRNWVQRYEKMGLSGLEDRRGRRIGSQPARTPEEELRDKIAEMERMNLDLQMENDILKKVRELEMKDRCL